MNNIEPEIVYLFIDNKQYGMPKSGTWSKFLLTQSQKETNTTCSQTINGMTGNYWESEIFEKWLSRKTLEELEKLEQKWKQTIKA